MSALPRCAGAATGAADGVEKGGFVKTQKIAGLLFLSFLIKLLLTVSFQKASVVYTTQIGWLDV